MYNYNLGLLFESVVSDNTDCPAILFSENEKICFRELNCLSNQIARYLLDLKVNKSDVIGIFNNKAKRSYALMIACVKIGAIYVNLDGTSPFERLKKIITQCSPVLLFYDQSEISELIKEFQIPQIDINSGNFGNRLEFFQDTNPEMTKSICSDNPAYIMFTSGSTGFPKGAVMTHQNLLNFIKWTQQTYKIEKHDILTNVNPMYFDNSVFDFYASLFNGASMVSADTETVRSPLKLVSYLDKVKATIWFSILYVC